MAAMPNAGAQESYRINGVNAPQVKPQLLAGELSAKLHDLKQQIMQRSKTVSLGQALEEGMLNNPQLAAAYAEIQGQQWNLIAVRRQWYPTLSASSNPYTPGQSFTQTTERNGTFPERVTTTRITGTSPSISIGWGFFDPSRGANINSANENLKQQQLLFDVSARNLVLEIQQAYFALQEQERLINSYTEILSFTNRQVEITEGKFNAGMVSIADVEQIRTQQFSTLSTLINAYRLLIDSSSRLAEVMALTPGTLALPSDGLSTLSNWDTPLQATIKQALNLREEIQASLAAAASAGWRASALFNTYWPSFSIGASAQYRRDSRDSTTTAGGDRVTDSTMERSWNAAVGLGFTWQFFDGGINAAQAEVQKAIKTQALDEADIRRLRITREVEQSYSAYLTAQLAIESSGAQANAARSAAIAVQRRFDVGVTDMSTLVVALNQAIVAENTYATAVNSYNSAVASLYRSSARWPAGTQVLLEQRVNKLRRQ
jgi:outer membrane protein TolC